MLNYIFLTINQKKGGGGVDALRKISRRDLERQVSLITVQFWDRK